MDNLGHRIKQLREKQELPLRTVAAFLDIDQAILSKIEHGHRMATREQVLQLAKYFRTDERELLVIWLSDKLVQELKDEDLSKQALKAAEKKVELLKQKKTK
jgi:HTH-type transcriptional regulator, competence development regulator